MTLNEKRQELAEKIMCLTAEEMAELIRRIDNEIKAGNLPPITKSEITV